MCLGVKVNGAYYRDNLLAQKLLPDLFRLSQGGFLFSNRTAPRRIEHATPSLSWSKVCQTSFLQHCGHRIHRIRTPSTIASGVYRRRKFTDRELLTLTNLKRV